MLTSELWAARILPVAILVATLIAIWLRYSYKHSSQKNVNRNQFHYDTKPIHRRSNGHNQDGGKQSSDNRKRSSSFLMPLVLYISTTAIHNLIGKIKWDSMVAFTAILAVFSGLQWCTLHNTDETLHNQERAQVIPVGASLEFPPLRNEGIVYKIDIINTGHEPASKINIAIANGSTPGITDPTKEHEIDLSVMPVPHNRSCDGLNPAPGRPTVPPTGSDQGSSFGIDLGSKFGKPARLVDDAILNGAEFYVANGCFVYLDGRDERFSSFCYILMSVPNTFQINVPRAKVTNGRKFFFVTCDAGFNSD